MAIEGTNDGGVRLSRFVAVLFGLSFSSLKSV